MVKSATEKIANRWEKALQIPNTQKLHFVKVADSNKINAQTSKEMPYILLP